jgi:hypothetical protein
MTSPATMSWQEKLVARSNPADNLHDPDQRVSEPPAMSPNAWSGFE